jgi:hypothetical protein
VTFVVCAPVATSVGGGSRYRAVPNEACALELIDYVLISREEAETGCVLSPLVLAPRRRAAPPQEQTSVEDGVIMVVDPDARASATITAPRVAPALLQRPSKLIGDG